MREVGAFEAKNTLGTLLDRVLEGEEIVITRDSKPVARLLPFLPGATDARPRFDSAAHTRQLQRFWKKRPAQPASDMLLSRDRDE